MDEEKDITEIVSGAVNAVVEDKLSRGLDEFREKNVESFSAVKDAIDSQSSKFAELEEKISDLSSRNESLSSENDSMRERISDLDDEISKRPVIESVPGEKYSEDIDPEDVVGDAIYLSGTAYSGDLRIGDPVKFSSEHLGESHPMTTSYARWSESIKSDGYELSGVGDTKTYHDLEGLCRDAKAHYSTSSGTTSATNAAVLISPADAQAFLPKLEARMVLTQAGVETVQSVGGTFPWIEQTDRPVASFIGPEAPTYPSALGFNYHMKEVKTIAAMAQWDDRLLRLPSSVNLRQIVADGLNTAMVQKWDSAGLRGDGTDNSFVGLRYMNLDTVYPSSADTKILAADSASARASKIDLIVDRAQNYMEDAFLDVDGEVVGILVTNQFAAVRNLRNSDAVRIYPEMAESIPNLSGMRIIKAQSAKVPDNLGNVSFGGSADASVDGNLSEFYIFNPKYFKWIREGTMLIEVGNHTILKSDGATVDPLWQRGQSAIKATMLGSFMATRRDGTTVSAVNFANPAV